MGINFRIVNGEARTRIYDRLNKLDSHRWKMALEQAGETYEKERILKIKALEIGIKLVERKRRESLFFEQNFLL